MIPYFSVHFPSLGPWQVAGKTIGPLTVHLFGILVACGILLGSKLTRDRGRELGLEDEKVASMITTVLVCGFLFAHFFDVFAYQTAGENPSLWQWLNPFGGISSYGGFMGAVGGLFYWCKKNKTDVMPYADSLGYGLAAGWMCGRTGCFTAHDHPGLHTDFFLAVQYPGGARHDLGLYEALWSAGIALMFFIMHRRGKQPLGLYVSILVTGYAPVRFILDFLRASDVHGADPRYAGLTPGQWSSVVALVAGLGLARWSILHARAQKHAPAPTGKSARK